MTEKNESNKPAVVTADKIREKYPEQINEIVQAVVNEINGLSTGEFRKRCPDVYGRLTEEIRGENKAIKVDGFYLDPNDPFAEGVLHYYAQRRGLAGLKLPYTLPFAEKETVQAIKNYYLRANGASDKTRAAEAAKILKDKYNIICIICR